jgi:UDP:flavonoid glycosyltransferase YjiC (YdhE family)
MRVLSLVLGTRGDVELAVALGRELARRSHQVTIASSPFHRRTVVDAGLGWLACGNGQREDLIAIMRSLEPVDDLGERAHRYFHQWVRPQLREGQGAIEAAAAGCDYFVNNLKIAPRGGGITAGAMVVYEPTGDPSRLALLAAQRPDDGRVLRLVALERRLVDPEREWDPAYRFTGFWDLPAPDARPPLPVVEFVERGSPPVVLTQGSMTVSDGPALAATFAEALRIAGHRGLLVGGWSPEPRRPLDDTLDFVREAPYHWLFPRAACVIHHGGCGTVQAVLRAGRPSVLLPQITSQAHFARILQREGLAVRSFDTRTLHPQPLAEAIVAACSESRYAAASARWQAVLAASDGLTAAADAIEAHRATLATA